MSSVPEVSENTISLNSGFTAEDYEAAAVLMSLRSAPSRESCPSTACAACACGGRRVTRSQFRALAAETDRTDTADITDISDVDYSDMPALIPIETPRFRLLENTENTDEDYSDMPALIPLERARGFPRLRQRQHRTRPLRIAALRGLPIREFEAVLGSLDNASLESLRRTSDQALASEVTLHSDQRATLLEELRERASEDALAFTARRSRSRRS